VPAEEVITSLSVTALIKEADLPHLNLKWKKKRMSGYASVNTQRINLIATVRIVHYNKIAHKDLTLLVK
jgi:hypothetical protein